MQDAAFKAVGVMHLTDTLDAGGLERVAVNLSNLMPRSRYHLHLCTTRREGPLSDLVAGDVGRLCLGRKHRYDLRAIRQLARYLRQHDIRILHAHGTSLLTANLVSHLRPFPCLVWHDHFGSFAIKKRPLWAYRLLTRRAQAVVCVSQPLAQWCRFRLRVREDRIFYLPNFSVEAVPARSVPALPGSPGCRIVCVANLRPAKDHETLLLAMSRVHQQVPQAHLLLVGAAPDAKYAACIRQLIADHHLQDCVTLFGPSRHVMSILNGCDIGVLSSKSEAFPLTLIEYGMASLAVVTTLVGQCPEVVEYGRAGRLVPPTDPEALADTVTSLLQSESPRRKLGERLNQRVREHYSPESALRRIERVYASVTAGVAQ